MSKHARSSLLRGARPLTALAGGAGLVVALGAAVIVTIGLGGGEEDQTSTVAAASTTTLPRATVTATTAPRGPIVDRAVRMVVNTAAIYGSDPPVADGLAARSVLLVTAAGFEPNSRGLVEQCTVGGCARAFPVLFDSGGVAQFQYLVDDSFANAYEARSRCRADDPPCVVHLRSGTDSAFLTTVFHDDAPPPRRVVVDAGADGVVEGEQVRVSVTGFSPGERVQAMMCAAPDTFASSRCGEPGPVAPFGIDAHGTGQTSLVIRAGRIGSAGASCGRSTPCGIVVSSPRSSVPSPVFPVVFGAGPAAHYDGSRLITGLTIAIVLLALALLLARTTDWHKPTEADTPDLDGAVLTD